jgi:hypothetical protein
MEPMVGEQHASRARQGRPSDDDLVAELREAAAMWRTIAADVRRSAPVDGPLVRAARRVERFLGIGR